MRFVALLLVVFFPLNLAFAAETPASFAEKRGLTRSADEETTFREGVRAAIDELEFLPGAVKDLGVPLEDRGLSFKDWYRVLKGYPGLEVQAARALAGWLDYSDRETFVPHPELWAEFIALKELPPIYTEGELAALTASSPIGTFVGMTTVDHELLVAARELISKPAFEIVSEMGLNWNESRSKYLARRFVIMCHSRLSLSLVEQGKMGRILAEKGMLPSYWARTLLRALKEGGAHVPLEAVFGLVGYSPNAEAVLKELVASDYFQTLTGDSVVDKWVAFAREMYSYARGADSILDESVIPDAKLKLSVALFNLLESNPATVSAIPRILLIPNFYFFGLAGRTEAFFKRFPELAPVPSEMSSVPVAHTGIELYPDVFNTGIFAAPVLPVSPLGIETQFTVLPPIREVVTATDETPAGEAVAETDAEQKSASPSPPAAAGSGASLRFLLTEATQRELGNIAREALPNRIQRARQELAKKKLSHPDSVKRLFEILGNQQVKALHQYEMDVFDLWMGMPESAMDSRRPLEIQISRWGLKPANWEDVLASFGRFDAADEDVFHAFLRYNITRRHVTDNFVRKGLQMGLALRKSGRFPELAFVAYRTALVQATTAHEIALAAAGALDILPHFASDEIFWQRVEVVKRVTGEQRATFAKHLLVGAAELFPAVDFDTKERLIRLASSLLKTYAPLKEAKLLGGRTNRQFWKAQFGGRLNKFYNDLGPNRVGTTKVAACGIAVALVGGMAFMLHQIATTPPPVVEPPAQTAPTQVAPPPVTKLK